MPSVPTGINTGCRDMKAVVGLFVVAGLICAAGPSYAAKKMYRFEVDGQVIIKDYVPAEYVHLGYDILNHQGMVIGHVDRAPTAEELARKKAAEAARQARKDAIEQQKQADMNLLRLYAAPEDVERARQRKADEVDSYIQLQRRRIADLQAKLEKSQGQAANIERRGRDVPADMRLEIVELQNAIRDSEKNIDDRQQEIITATREFADQYERVRILQVYPPGTLDADVDLDKVDQAFE